MKLVIIFIIFINVLFADVKKVTLNEAIEIALDNNRQSKISKLALEIANAQYQQALSANYPALNAMVVGQRVKENLIYQQRGSFALPTSLSNTFGALVFGNKSAADQQSEIGSIMIANPGVSLADATNMAIANEANNYSEIRADMDTIAAGRDTIRGSLNVLYPLFTGGKISSVIEQAKLNKLLAMNTITRNDLNVVYDIKKYFYGYVLTNELYKIAKATLNRMNYVSTLTKQFYEGGDSLNVKKTDYLSIQVTVALIESIVAKIDANRFMVKSALANSMGLAWDSEIEAIYSQDNLLPSSYSLSQLVAEAYRSNSDIRKMDIALKISKEQIAEKQSGHYPQIALMGEASHTYNSYEYGYLSDDRENSWNIGFAAEIPLFDGFKTTNMVNEKKIERKKLYLLQDMMKDGIALQIKNELNTALIGFKQIQTLKKAKKLAKASRELNIRGYQIDAITPQKVIEAQYIESYVKADYLKYVHDYLLSLAKIDKLVGQELK